MARREADDVEFAEFVTAYERRLRQAFTSIWGPERGRDVAVDALAYGWEHWGRVRSMDNPVGYLFVVGRERANRHRRREQSIHDFVVPSPTPPPWYEPALPGLIEELSDRERQVVVLLHAFEWSLGEIAELLEISKSSVQTYADRAMSKLRSGLGVQA